VTVNTERVRLLVDALRSGGFAQGKGKLLKDGEYCCLGVACVVAQHEGLPLRLNVPDDQEVEFGDPANWDADHDYAQLPHSVRDWYGFDHIDPDLLGDDPSAEFFSGPVILPASAWNDDYDRDFNWIADAFERTYLRG
jgi:hypothetical protein